MRSAIWVVVVGVLLAACGSPDKEADERMKAERATAEAKAKKLAEATKPDPTGDQPVKFNKGQLIDKCEAGDAPSCQGACALEDGDSCTRFATMFEEAKGVPEDFEAARDFHNKGCTYGSGQGCYSLGLFYKLGKSSIKSPEKAAEYFAAGCKLGFQPACDEVNAAADPAAAPTDEKK
jgi:hypothetical protein